MLTFVGLGLWDERSVTVAGRDAIRAADRCFAEFYTSRLMGTTVADLEAFHDVSIEVRDRSGVEEEPDPILAAAEGGEAVFLTAGDPMISTTHVDLRLRAADRGIETRIVHAPTAQSAASSLTGLQNYRFGKATTLPFPRAHGGDGVPASVIDTIEANRDRGLHTLVYLDIKTEALAAEAGTDTEAGAETYMEAELERDTEAEAERAPRGRDWGPADAAIEEAFMSGSKAAELLAEHWGPNRLGVVVARAGSPDPVVVADRLDELADGEFGGPLHLLVIPGEVHHIEAEALVEFAGAPDSVLED